MSSNRNANLSLGPLTTDIRDKAIDDYQAWAAQTVLAFARVLKETPTHEQPEVKANLDEALGVVFGSPIAEMEATAI